MLKTSGYLVSTISVVLLGVVSWESASKNPVLLSCLIMGMTASTVGMLLRWLSYRHERKQIQGAASQLSTTSLRSQLPSGKRVESVAVSRRES